jgi:two-component system, chemotaxis family, chemotaxis protein CheY
VAKAETSEDAGLAPTILVVDDDPDMRFLARAILEGSGVEVAAEAPDGPQALEKLRELKAPPIPTVVLLDNQMPGLTGLETASRILDSVPNQLIILFSAYLSDEIVAEAQRMGITACVSKNEAMNLAEIVKDLVRDNPQES